MNIFLNESQIATTIEQSKQLSKYGLKPETADMCYYRPYPNDIYKLTVREPYYGDDIPAWSLDRLVKLLNVGMKEHNGNDSRFYALDNTKNMYIQIIEAIEQLINRGYLKFYTV